MPKGGGKGASREVSNGTAALLAVLSLALSAIAGGPREAVQAAATDLRTVPAALQPYMRYMSLYNLPRDVRVPGTGIDIPSRSTFLRVLSFHCNSLSREPELVRPVLVASDLVRVNLLDYTWDAKTWEKLALADPYFHKQNDIVRAEAKVEYDEYGYWTRTDTSERVTKEWVEANKNRVGCRFITTRKVPKTSTSKSYQSSYAYAAHGAEMEYEYLIKATGSQVPIVRADWFLVYSAIQEGRIVGYYDFLGLGEDEKDFQALVGADVNLAKKVKKEIAGVVGISGVTVQNRSLERFATINGYYWRSHDFKTSTLKQNTLRLLDGDTEPPQGDASEQYAALANGLLAVWLQNADAKRQNVAPPDIASDSHSTSNDRQVHVGLSCFRCHAEGIRPINEWMRNVYRDEIQLTSVDYEKLRRLRQLYLSDLERHVKADQSAYAIALLECNGLTPEANATAYARVWQEYQDTPLDLSAICREMGTTVTEFKPKLESYAKRYGADPVILGLLAKVPQTVRREHFEEIYHTLWDIHETKP